MDSGQTYTCLICFRTRKDNGEWCLYCGAPHEFESEQHKQQWEVEYEIEIYPDSVIICSNCGKRAFLEGKGLCRLCYGKKHSRAYCRKYPDKRRNSVLKHEYGITKKQYDFMLASQGNSCAICGKTPKENGRGLAVDHDHETGAIRGLLCTNCNLGLGSFYDNPKVLLNAIAYLAKAKE